MKESVLKMSSNCIESVVSDGNNRSELKIDKYGIHISSNKKTITISSPKE